MRKLFAALIGLLWFSVVAHAQTTTVAPDCVHVIVPITAVVGTSRLFDNRGSGCNYWTLSYTGFRAATIGVAIVDAVNSNNTPGTPALWEGNINNGLTMPVTAGSSGSISVTGYFPYVGVSVTTMSASGSLQGVLYGWRYGPAVQTQGLSSLIMASSSVAVSIATSGVTQIIPAVTSRTIFVTAYGLTVGTSTATGQNVTFVHGTGTNCATGLTALTGALSAGTALTFPFMPSWFSEGNGTGAIMVVPASRALCIQTTGAQAVGGKVSFAQLIAP